MLRNISSYSRQVPLTCTGHTRPVVHLDFGGVKETGFFLLSASKDGRPILRDGQTGEYIGSFEGHKGAVCGVALNNNASLAATAAADFTAKIWSANSGNTLLDLQHKHIVKSASFDTRSERLVTGGYEKMLRVFNLEHLSNDPVTFIGHERPITRVLFCRDNKCLLSASEDHSLRLWDINSGKEVMCSKFPDGVFSPEISLDGANLTFASGNKVLLWDVAKMEQIVEYPLPVRALSATLHPEKKILVCGGEDLKLHKIKCDTGEEIDTLRGHFGTINAVKFSPAGDVFASGSEDGTLRLWQTSYEIERPYGYFRYGQSKRHLFNNGE